MSKLKSCPFCGCVDIDEYEGDFGNGVYCMNCGAMMGEPIHMEYRVTERVSMEQAIAAWNTRAAVTDHDFAMAVHDGNLWGKCSECKERQGYYLDAETIRNQQERIAELERALEAKSLRLVMCENEVGGYYDILRDVYDAYCFECDPWAEGFACAFFDGSECSVRKRMEDMGIVETEGDNR